MLKIGHRGAKGYEPENTLLSFSKAIDLRVDMIEMDIYKCKSGELVVIHDDKVDRTTNGKGYVEEKTISELKRLDAGKGQQIPLLEEVLDLFGKKIKINIELKGNNTGDTLVIFLKAKKIKTGNLLISSFKFRELEKFHQLMPKVKVGVLLRKISSRGLKFAEKIRAVSIHLAREAVNGRNVRSIHQKGMKVFVFTVNDPDEMKKMKDFKVDGIFSNFPDRI